MTKAVTPEPLRASKRQREQLRQRGDEMIQRWASACRVEAHLPMTKTVTPKPSRASKRQRALLRQQGDEMIQRLTLVTEALEYYGHVYMQKTVADAQAVIKLLVDEL